MPVFANLAAMQARFETRDLLQLSDDDNTGAIVQARIDAAIDSADATIVSYIAARHSNAAELAGNPVLTDIACDIAFYRLFRSNAPEWVITRWKAAMNTLRDIANGTVKLDGGSEEAAPRPGQILTNSAPQKFGRKNLEGF